MTIQELAMNILCSFIGTIGFAIMYNVPLKYYIGCGVTGTAGWLMYLFAHAQTYMTAATASFAGALVVVLISRLLSVRMKCPITIFLISGIFPLVPGVGVYNTVYYFVTNQLAQASLKGIESIKIAFAIVMGIVIVLSIPREVFQIVYWRKRLRKKVEDGK